LPPVLKKGPETMHNSNQSAANTPGKGPCERAPALVVGQLKPAAGYQFDVTLTDAACQALIKDLGLLGIKKLRFHGQISAVNKQDWQLRAELGATVQQACVVTGVPVTTRIDEAVARQFVKALETPETSGETQFDGDDSTESLGDVIDLHDILTESLALALPDYPRAEGAELGEAVFSAPGITPMRDEDVKPFAALAALRDKLEK
jgi:uncharacterized metal-binding protein YceD (DUF177 family)